MGFKIQGLFDNTCEIYLKNCYVWKKHQKTSGLLTSYRQLDFSYFTLCFSRSSLCQIIPMPHQQTSHIALKKSIISCSSLKAAIVITLPIAAAIASGSGNRSMMFAP